MPVTTTQCAFVGPVMYWMATGLPSFIWLRRRSSGSLLASMVHDLKFFPVSSLRLEANLPTRKPGPKLLYLEQSMSAGGFSTLYSRSMLLTPVIPHLPSIQVGSGCCHGSGSFASGFSIGSNGTSFFLSLEWAPIGSTQDSCRRLRSLLPAAPVE